MGIHGSLPPVPPLPPSFGMPNAGDSSDKSVADCIREGVATLETYLANHDPNDDFPTTDNLPLGVVLAMDQISASASPQMPGATPEVTTAAQNYLKAFSTLLTQGTFWHKGENYTDYTGPRDVLINLLNKLQPPTS